MFAKPKSDGGLEVRREALIQAICARERGEDAAMTVARAQYYADFLDGRTDEHNVVPLMRKRDVATD